MESKSRGRDAETKAMILRKVLSNYHYDKVHGKVCRKNGRIVHGSNKGNRYLQLIVQIRQKRYKTTLHQIVWMLNTGKYPDMIDHINGDRTDNRIENLREADISVNNCNKCIPWKPNLKTGVPGVCEIDRGRFQTRIFNTAFNAYDKYELFQAVTLLGRSFLPDHV